MTYTAQQALGVALFNNADKVGGLSLAQCMELARGVHHSLTSMGFDLDDTRHLAMGSPHLPTDPPTDDTPRPWDGHACSAMLPAPYARYCPWCQTQPTKYLTEEEVRAQQRALSERDIFGDEIDEEPSHGYWEAGDYG